MQKGDKQQHRGHDQEVMTEETEMEQREIQRESGRQGGHASATEQSSLRHWCFPSSFFSNLISKDSSTKGGLPIFSCTSLSL